MYVGMHINRLMKLKQLQQTFYFIAAFV